MKTVLVYLRVSNPTDVGGGGVNYYSFFEQRFIRTYKQYKPECEHSLIFLNRGKADSVPTIPDIASLQINDDKPGWDIGAYQRVLPLLECDLAVFMATPVHFWQPNWLEPLIEAAQIYGKGVYAPQASYEVHPHLRTGCFATQPDVMRLYPLRVTNKEQAAEFESRENNFSLWAIHHGLQAKLVTRSECYDMQHWRKPPNIFRRGDQSNCLVWDRHNDIYFSATPDERAKLESIADGH